jgi:hypothetical protein
MPSLALMLHSKLLSLQISIAGVVAGILRLALYGQEFTKLVQSVLGGLWGMVLGA